MAADPGANFGRNAWSEEALATAKELADKLETAEIKCGDFGPVDIRMYDEDYRRRLPVMPAAVAACEGHSEEELLFEIFETPERALQFMSDKMGMLCRKAKSEQIPFPGISYVDGGYWLVEPDDKATSDRIAPILGGESRWATCSD